MTPGAVAKQRFRDFGDHVREIRCCSAVKAYRDHVNFRTIVFCPCDVWWIFTDVALRETPYILDYFSTCGLGEDIVAPILNFRPLPGAWGKVLLGFLGDDDPV